MNRVAFPVHLKPSPWGAVLLGLVCLGGTLWYWQALRAPEVAPACAAQPVAAAVGPVHALSTVALTGGSLVAFLLGFGLYSIQCSRLVNQRLREEAEDHEEAEARVRRSEARLRQVVEHISDVCWLATPDKKRVLYVSPAYETVWGRTRESLVRNPEAWFETMHPEDRERLRADRGTSAAAGYDREYRIVRPDGTERWIRDRAFPVRNAAGVATAVAGIAQDITQQRNTVSALQQQHRLMAAIVEGAPEVISVKDRQGRYLFMNEAGARFLNKTPDEVIGRDDSALMPADIARDAAALDRKVFDQRVTVTRDQAVRLDQRDRTLQTTKRPYVDATGRVAGVIGVSRDVTEERAAEARLRASEAQFSQLFFDAPVGLVIVDDQQRLLKVNQAFCDLVGYDEHELIGQTSARYIHPDDLAAELAFSKTLFSGERPTDRQEKRCVRKNGEVTWVAITAKRIRLPNHSSPVLLTTVEDITARKQAETEETLQEAKRKLERHVAQRTAELALANHRLRQDVAARKQAEEALVQSEARYRALFDDNPSMCFTLDLDGTVLDVNRFGAAQLGYGADELVGRPVSTVFHPEDCGVVMERLQQRLLDGGDDTPWEIRKVRKDGTVLWVSETARFLRAPDGRRIFLITGTDVTARKQAEEALRRSERAMRDLYEVTSSSRLSLRQQVEAILDLGRHRFDLDIGLLTRIAGEQLELTHVRSMDEAIPVGRVIPLSGSPCADALISTEPLCLEVWGGSPFRRHLAHAELGLQCYLGTRVLVDGKPHGTLCFASRTVRSSPFSDADKAFLQLMARWIGTALEREQAASALRENDERTRAIIETSMDAVVVMDAHGVIREWNPQAERIFGWPRAEAVGRRLSDTIIPAHLRDAHERGLTRYLDTGEGPVLNTRVEITALRKDGSQFPVELSIAPLSLEQGITFSAFVRDITERKSAEESLREQARLATFTAEVSQTLNCDMTTDEILRSCAEMAVRHLDLAFARIWTLEPGDMCENCFKAPDCADRTRCLHLRASTGLSTNLHGEYRRVPLGTLKIGRIAQGTGVMFTNDVLSDDRLPGKEWIRQNGLQSFAGFPLIIEGEVYGVMGVFARMPLSEATRRTLEAVCNGIAATIVRKQTAGKLQLTQFTVDHAVDAIYWVDPRARILDVNHAACAMVGYSKDELCAMTVHDLNPDFPEERWPAFWEESKRRGTVTFETGHRSKDGRLIPVEITVNFLVYEGKEWHCAFVRDITERKKASASLTLFRSLLDQATDAVEVIDPDTARFLDVNEHAHSALGYTRQELLGMSVTDIDPLVTLPRFMDHVARLRNTGALTLETLHRRKDGATFPVEVSARLIRLDREYLLAIVRDITQRRKAEAERAALLGELQSANRALGHLSQQLMQVQETERRQLARDLHDEIGQALTAVTINLQSIKRQGTDLDHHTTLQDSLTIVNRILQRIRDLCLDLRPSMLDDLGLVPALRWYVNRQAARAGWTVEFQGDEAMPPIPEAAQVACYRIAQEALTNVMRHAGARCVSVRVGHATGRLELDIHDDGIGFDPGRPRALEGGHGGLGLMGMRERARHVGGEWTIHSTPGHGTTVSARLPIDGLAVTKAGQLAEVLS